MFYLRRLTSPILQHRRGPTQPNPCPIQPPFYLRRLTSPILNRKRGPSPLTKAIKLARPRSNRSPLLWTSLSVPTCCLAPRNLSRVIDTLIKIGARRKCGKCACVVCGSHQKHSRPSYFSVLAAIGKTAVCGLNHVFMPQTLLVGTLLLCLLLVRALSQVELVRLLA